MTFGVYERVWSTRVRFSITTRSFVSSTESPTPGTEMLILPLFLSSSDNFSL